MVAFLKMTPLFLYAWSKVCINSKSQLLKIGGMCELKIN